MSILRALLGLLAAALATTALAAAGDEISVESRSRALERATTAVVGLQALAVEDARSARTLGRARSGSGVVIGGDGLVLTIGYLILEAEQVLLDLDGERQVPARVVAYDQATGFGLVRALAPLQRPPAPLGDSAAVTTGEALLVASGGDDGGLSMAHLVSRRGFSGYWEYHIDGALFTAPAHPGHSGAALFNTKGELVGIGSLRVADVAGPGTDRLVGNMFVPVELLRPILPELLARGRSRGSERPWLGITCVEVDGGVRVMRVNEDSPADVAGIQAGDRIVQIDGVAVSALEQLWKTLWKGPGTTRAVKLEIQRDGETRELTVHSVDRAATLRRAEGI